LVILFFKGFEDNLLKEFVDEQKQLKIEKEVLKDFDDLDKILTKWMGTHGEKIKNLDEEFEKIISAQDKKKVEYEELYKEEEDFIKFLKKYPEHIQGLNHDMYKLHKGIVDFNKRIDVLTQRVDKLVNVDKDVQHERQETLKLLRDYLKENPKVSS
jgi:hypothetical protein